MVLVYKLPVLIQTYYQEEILVYTLAAIFSNTSSAVSVL